MTRNASGSAASRFAVTLINILDRVQYRRVARSDQFDPVYALRYAAYRREEFIPINSQKITRDAYDEADNCFCYGVYIDGVLVSSIRLHIASPAQPTSPSMEIWPDVLGKIVADGGTYIDPSRFTADYEASLAFPALPYVTLRLAVMACKHFEARYCISSVRSKHAAFYKRVFGSVQMAGEGHWGELTFPVCLYASHLPTMYPGTLERYPFFMSTIEERQKLFEPTQQPVAAISPTVRVAYRMRLIETVNA